MIDNLIQRVNELNQDGCFKNYSDYSFLIDELNKLKDVNEYKLNTALTALSSCRIDVLVSPYVEIGVAKMIVNTANFHDILRLTSKHLHENNINNEPRTPSK